jgi:hypothetical protein
MHAVCKPLTLCVSRFDSQACLANASGAYQCDQAALRVTQQPGQCSQLGLTPDQ